MEDRSPASSAAANGGVAAQKWQNVVLGLSGGALFRGPKTGEDGSGFMAFSEASREVILLAGQRGGQREELRRGLLGFGKVVLRFPGGVQWLCVEESEPTRQWDLRWRERWSAGRA